MSSDFIQMVADLTERRLLRTMQTLTARKTPCAIFFAPAMPVNARQIVDSFKQSGINLNCVCVLSKEQKNLFKPSTEKVSLPSKNSQASTSSRNTFLF